MSRTHCSSGTGGLQVGWISMTRPDDDLGYINLLSAEWADGTTKVDALVHNEKPPNPRGAVSSGEHDVYGHNSDYPHGVPPGKFQELAEFVVKERSKRQRYQAMARHFYVEVLMLRRQLAVQWETKDDEREQMELNYDAFVMSDRVGDEPDDDEKPSDMTPLMSAEGSLEGTHNCSSSESQPSADANNREEVEVVEVAAPAPSKKRKAPPPGFFLGSGGSSQDRVRVDSRDSMGKSMEY